MDITFQALEVIYCGMLIGIPKEEKKDNFYNLSVLVGVNFLLVVVGRKLISEGM